MCLGPPGYIPLLTERDRSGSEAINMLLLRSKNLSCRSSGARTLEPLMTFLAEPVSTMSVVLQRSTMFIALQNQCLCAPAERHVLCASRLHSAPNGAGLDQESEAINMLLLR